MSEIKTALQHAVDLVAEGQECTCDGPAVEPLTGHHWKCPVHTKAIERRRKG
jgi:hypothetical protein